MSTLWANILVWKGLPGLSKISMNKIKKKIPRGKKKYVCMILSQSEQQQQQYDVFQVFLSIAGIYSWVVIMKACGPNNQQAEMKRGQRHNNTSSTLCEYINLWITLVAAAVISRPDFKSKQTDDRVTQDESTCADKAVCVEAGVWIVCKKAALSSSQTEKWNCRFTDISQDKKKREDSSFVGSTNKNMQHTLSHPDQQVSWIKSSLQRCLTACALSLLCGEVQTYLFHFCFLTERRRAHSWQGQSSLKKSEVSHRHEIPLKNQHQAKNCASNSLWFTDFINCNFHMF